MRNHWFQAVKPLSSASETLGFTTWKQGFQIVIWWVLEGDLKTVYLCSFGEGKTVWGFRGKNYPLNGFTTRQPWQLNNNLDNSTTITTLFSYMLMLRLLFNRCSVVVHVVEWLFTLLCFPIYCDVCWCGLCRMGHGDPILRFMRYKIVRTITLEGFRYGHEIQI